MIRTLAVAVASAAALFAVSFAPVSQAQSTLVTNPAQVQAGAYKVEPSHTRVLFAVSHMGFSTWYGDFTGASGALQLDPANPANSRLDVTIPTGSVVTTNGKLDEELRSADWFDAARYPTITFKSRKVTVTAPGRADIAGDLTFHGVTRPVTLQARFNAAGANPLSKAYTVGFEVSGKIKRSDFGVTKYVPLIGDDVDLTISAAFEKAGA